MAENYTPTNVATFVNDTTAVNTVNNNFAAISTAFTDVLSRSGVSPNQMQSTLDMNGNQIINLSPPATINSPARLIDVVSNPTIVVPSTGTSGHTVPFLDGNNTWSGTNTYSQTPILTNTTWLQGLNASASPLNMFRVNASNYTEFSNTLYFDNTAAPFINRNAIFNIQRDTGGTAPTSIFPTMWSLVESKGDNTTQVGASAALFAAFDRSDVTALNKGILYGIQVLLNPIVARNHSPVDDVTGIVVQNNSSTIKATDAIFVGASGNTGSAWVTGVLVSENCDFAYRASGKYAVSGIDLSLATLTTNAITTPGFTVGPSGLVLIGNPGISTGSVTLAGTTSGFATIGTNATASAVGLTVPLNVGLVGGASGSVTLLGSTSGSVQLTTPSASGGVMQFASAGSFTANGAVATALTSVGPAGSHTTVQNWLTIIDNTGTTRYIPCF